MSTRSSTTSIEILEAKGKETKSNIFPHVITACENDCDTSKWHIARTNYKLNAKCHAQQKGLNIKCSTKIAKEKKGILAPTYRGRKVDYGNK